MRLAQMSEAEKMESLPHVFMGVVKAEEAETVLASSQEYRTPPPPEQTLLTSLAYVSPTKRKPATAPPKVAAVEVAQSSDGNTQLAEMFSRMLDERLGKFEKKIRLESERSNKNEQKRHSTHHNKHQGNKLRSEALCYNCNKPGHFKSASSRVTRVEKRSVFAAQASRAEKRNARLGEACAEEPRTASESSPEKQEQHGAIITPNPKNKNKARKAGESMQEPAALSSLSAETADEGDEAGQCNEDNLEEKRWWMKARVGSFRFRTLYDNRTSRVCMGPIGLQLASALGRQLMTSHGRAKLVDGSYTKIVGYVWLPFRVGNVEKEVRVAIIPDLPTDCIVGVNFMLTFKAVLDPTTSKLHFKESKKYVNVELATMEGDALTLASMGLADVEEQQREALRALLDKIIGPETGEIGCTTCIEHHIEVHTTSPIKQKYFSVSKKIEEEMHEQVKAMLAVGIMEPSNSAFARPVVMVWRAIGKYRFCVDFRKVNAITRNDTYPHLSSAYHQIPVSEESKQYTAFTVPGMGLFQFKRLPFGLSEAGATFQRLMDKIITPELQQHAFSYLDDVIVATETFEDHVKVLERVLKRIKEAGLTVNREKRVFCKEEVKYLGVLVNRDGFRPDPEKIAPIVNFPQPKNLKQLRRFHGMASWYRQFLEGYAALAEPLTRLTRKDQPFVWGEDQQSAFEAIKTLVASAPVLHCPDFDQQFVIQIDASDTGFGVVLTQNINGQDRVLEFASRVLTLAERNYTVSERECLAVLFAVRKFRQYIEGYEFKVITDHSSLRWLCNLRNPTGRLIRWALKLQGHKYTIEHRKGADHHVPDALSRMYEETEPEIASVSQDPQPQDCWPDPNTTGAMGDNDDDDWKLVVPAKKRLQVLQECHDQPTAGYFGREKTYKRLTEKYFWPRAYQDMAAQGIHHSYSPPYHPQANPVERVNRTIKREIAAFTEENHRAWDEHISEIAFSFNTAVHEATGASPAMMNFGRQPAMPASLRAKEDQEAARQGAVGDWQARLAKLPLHEREKALSGEAQDRHASYFDARRRAATFKVDDIVAKRRHVLSSAAGGIAAKLALPYVGPYTITA
ncbi:uncharacterized protein LOC103315702 [Nasonia vitripennis]|uniref:RNA-directed DNA polymerase n=1 Tax=Nasonia vitripennis TaxID=7425 RepID=A0A7M7H8F6_NASVI|nr:uncharacterized protein LOC103315702 [Nasonia vitripennis]